MERVLVVGGGAMGSGIAVVAARAGCVVDVVEPDAGARERSSLRLRRAAEKSGDARIERSVSWLNAIPERSEATVAVEAVSERFDLKRDVFVALERALSSQALLATNTSSLSVEELADVVSSPQRVLGLHFFNPPEAMQLIEVVHAPQTCDDAIERAYAFVESLGKTAVLTADTPGFVVNRVARPYYLQAMRALERGAASVEELDELARGVGFRMGPFELMDFIGLDVNLATSESIYERTGETRLIPIELQREMVERGELGRKSGKGFYAYPPGPQTSGRPAREEPNGDDDARNTEEYVALLGFGSNADDMGELLAQHFANVQRIENDELLDELSARTTIVVDLGDGTTDRSEMIAQLDTLLGPETVFFVDAYATDLEHCARRMRHPQRLVGYGVLGSIGSQACVEIVDTDDASEDALGLGEELFESIGKRVVLVENVPGLFLGRVVGSIVNEAVGVVHDEIATPDDVDVAMRLGTNYPIGPIAWGREIGGARLTRILQRLAQDEGTAFAPHRALWVLDLDEERLEERSEVGQIEEPAP
jgi:3-hydroxybutyryl-CoA dehydrogenase